MLLGWVAAFDLFGLWRSDVGVWYGGFVLVWCCSGCVCFGRWCVCCAWCGCGCWALCVVVVGLFRLCCVFLVSLGWFCLFVVCLLLSVVGLDVASFVE